MGCWNGTCAISNLHITAGQRVAVFMLAENSENKSFCYGNAMYDVYPLPFYGEYNDYGAVENCHGFGLPILLDAIKERLYEFGTGPNDCHDIAVNKENFDIDMLFEADHENRLGIQDANRWNTDEYHYRELDKKRLENGLTASQEFELDRLANKIKKIDTFRRVTHVIIHGDIFNDIMTKWYIESYVGDGKGDKGYENNYEHIYFKDIEDSIPEYVAAKKKTYDAAMTEEDPRLRTTLLRFTDREDWDSPNLTSKWMRAFEGGESHTFGPMFVKEYIREYEEKGDWAGLAAFLREILTAAWVNSFMSYTRKAWSKQVGMGSQNAEHIGYEVLIQSMADVIAAEKAEQESWEREDEDVEDETVPESN
jgi:hypothetical protein